MVVEVRLWKEVPESFWFLPRPDAGPFHIAAPALATAIDIAETFVDFKPKYFQATRMR